MKMTRFESAVVKQMPFFFETSCRIHSDTEKKIARAARPQIERFPVNRLPVTYRRIFFSVNVYRAVLLHKKISDERDRQNHYC